METKNNNFYKLRNASLLRLAFKNPESGTKKKLYHCARPAMDVEAEIMALKDNNEANYQSLATEIQRNSQLIENTRQTCKADKEAFESKLSQFMKNK